MVLPWTKHLRHGWELIRRAFDAALQTGELNYAAYCCGHLVTNLLACGRPLGDVQGEAEKLLGYVRELRFGLMVDIVSTQVARVRMLRGLTLRFGSFNDGVEEFHENRFERHLEEDPRLAIAACLYWIHRLQGHFYAEDYASATEAAAKAQALLWTLPSFYEGAEYHFFAALALAAQCHAVPGDERPRRFTALLTHHRQIAWWAENCPENFADCAALVAAEIARLEGRELDAERLYEEAIRLAREHGFIQDEGLANELAARFHAARGFATIAHAYLRDARYCYLRWGAEGKVRQLDQSHPRLREESTSLLAATTIGASA